MSIWELLGRSRPKPNLRRRIEFFKALQKLWLAGALGALFFSIARNLPNHLPMFEITNPNYELTLILWLKYMYITWFVFYFMVSAMDNEQSKTAHGCKDIMFDLFQSTSALIAAYFLGFVIPLKNDDVVIGYTSALLTILLICFTSYCFFYEEARKGVNTLRGLGTLLSLSGLVSCLFFFPRNDPFRGYQELYLYSVLFGVQFLLLVILYIYLRIGYDEPG
jgi:peptidoglycan/LPS O-acetylase OafA/YrhL